MLLPAGFDVLAPPTPLPESPAPSSLRPYGSLAQGSSQCRSQKSTNSAWWDVQTTDHRWLAHQCTGLPLSKFRVSMCVMTLCQETTGRVGLHRASRVDYRRGGTAMLGFLLLSKCLRRYSTQKNMSRVLCKLTHISSFG